VDPFISELEAFKDERLAAIVGSGRTSITDAGGDPKSMLQVALANEINVSELAALWMPTTPEIDVKLAFARQAGDEAGHFMVVADRLRALGFDVDAFAAPDNPLFQYLRGLSTTVDRVAAGLFTLESIAYGVNENFIAFCAARGDDETVRIYREYIQPDEAAHQKLGQVLLEKYATTDAQQQAARQTVAKVLELATATRAKAAERLGNACVPGC
jgi:uncharacterized ferritin-like protein (DUF455 family)